MSLIQTPEVIGLYRRRKAFDRIMSGVMVAATACAVIPLFLILFYLVTRGIPGLNLDLFTELPSPTNVKGGGAKPAFIGSGVMVGIGLLIGVPVAIGTGIFLSEYGQNRIGSFVRFIIEVMAGIPSITVGLFIYAIIVKQASIPYIGGHYSALAGAIALAILLVPIVARITEEMLLLVPRSIREASYALGAPRWKTTLTIVFPTALPGIITGVMLGLSRIAGEAAPLLFTALGQNFDSTDITQPMDSLPRRIFFFAQNNSPADDHEAQAWAMSLILVGVILTISLTVRAIFGSRVTVRS